MSMTIRAVYDNGVFRPKEPINLPERTEVDVLVPEHQDSEDSGWKAWDRFAGLWKDAADIDIAEKHD